MQTTQAEMKPPAGVPALDDSPRPAAARVPLPDAPGLRRGLPSPDATATWSLSACAGRLVEISGDRSGAALTLAFRLVLDAQQRQEPVVWIGRRHSVFFPPDVAGGGVDLDALVVVWAPQTIQAARAADHLLRSGAFGLVLLDIGDQEALPIAIQTRLAGLAHKHDTALICITEKESRTPSLGSLVSLRAQTARTERVGDRYRCEVRILKDKRRGPGWIHQEVYRGPDGLC